MVSVFIPMYKWQPGDHLFLSETLDPWLCVPIFRWVCYLQYALIILLLLLLLLYVQQIDFASNLSKKLTNCKVNVNKWTCGALSPSEPKSS